MSVDVRMDLMIVARMLGYELGSREISYWR